MKLRVDMMTIIVVVTILLVLMVIPMISQAQNLDQQLYDARTANDAEWAKEKWSMQQAYYNLVALPAGWECGDDPRDFFECLAYTLKEKGLVFAQAVQLNPFWDGASPQQWKDNYDYCYDKLVEKNWIK